MENTMERYIGENLKTLRRFLHLTQQEFIDHFFMPPDGAKCLSVSRLSLLENGNTVNLDQMLDVFCVNTGIVKQELAIPPAEFVHGIDRFIEARFPQSSNKASMPGLLPVKRSSLIEDVVKTLSDYLTNGILNDQFKPGDKLPAERELAQILNIGRSTLREAMKALSVIGLLSIRPGHGTFIAFQNTDFFGASLSWSLLISDHLSKDIMEVRSILECESAYNAALRGSEEDMEELKQIFEHMTSSYNTKSIPPFFKLDMDFHLAIVRVARNQVAYHMMAMIRKLMQHYSERGMSSQEDLTDIYIEHAAIYRALTDRTPGVARSAMHEHLLRTIARQTGKRSTAK